MGAWNAVDALAYMASPGGARHASHGQLLHTLPHMQYAAVATYGDPKGDRRCAGAACNRVRPHGTVVTRTSRVPEWALHEVYRLKHVAKCLAVHVAHPRGAEALLTTQNARMERRWRGRPYGLTRRQKTCFTPSSSTRAFTYAPSCCCNLRRPKRRSQLCWSRMQPCADAWKCGDAHKQGT